MRKKTKIIGAAALAALALGAWLWSGRGGEENEAAARPPVPVRVAPVLREDAPLDLEAVGTAVANESVAVRTRMDSQIMEVRFKDGDRVAAGDLLFVLDDRALKAQLREQEAILARDKAQLAFLRQQYERQRRLSQSGYTAESSLDNARAAYEAQRAGVGATEAGAENLRVMLAYTRITAPISGRTGTIRLTVGNTVRAGDGSEPLVTIHQIQPIRVQASAPQRYLGALRAALGKGGVEAVAKREDGADARGALEYVDNAVDETTGTFVMRASFPNDDESLWPGMFVTLALRLGTEENALTVPEVAVQHGQDGDFVFVIAEGKAARRDIEVARLHRGRAVVPKGLKAGERVATDGLMTLADGAAVTVKE